jgi:hypothetical protein
MHPPTMVAAVVPQLPWCLTPSVIRDIMVQKAKQEQERRGFLLDAISRID